MISVKLQMELRWLADTPQSRRRTRALHACPTCRRKKKRCRHLGHDNLQLGISERSRANLLSRRPVREPPKPVGHTESNGGTSPMEIFVGDLNPEAALREDVEAANGAHHRDRVGLWITNHSLNVSSVAADPQSQSVTSFLRQRYSLAVRSYDRLPRSTSDHLIAIYFSRVNHILPLVDHALFTTEYAKGSASVFLERSICLVAAKDEAAAPHLRLTNDRVYSAREFCTELYGGLVCAMESGLEQDRITRIRIFALMSLHIEGYEGAEAASMHLCQAIHQAQTAGLHLERPGRQESLTALFWCLWSLDKMHASIGGRPVILADGDIGIRRNNRQKSAFDAWFALSEMLSKVISLYRPSAVDSPELELEYPTFDEIIGNPIREEMDFTTLGVLELYYHAISILSCRYKHSLGSYTRLELAAVRINSLVSSECGHCLPPLPVVPYAVSLSMGVSYQEARSSKLATQFERARASLETCCGLLEELSTWCTAEAMARLGRKALRQIDGTSFRSGKRGFIQNGSRAATSVPPSRSYFPQTHPLSSHDLLAVVDPKQGSTPLFDEQDYIKDPSSKGGLADIDMLFDEFLDLSLPTNFWDPVFMPPASQ
ncbi:hypothetical protein BDW74DRAFT_68718 [Aspergillus multicolor]|uniref:transcription factor domain-containing protein n=1 Tax=Aspergillus multicolor TaxID=41759 RepID=UPI003CCD5D32